MPAIKLSSLEVDENTVVVRPLRGNSDIVRSEKKYDRHGFAEVVVGAADVIEVPVAGGRTEWRAVNKGDFVVYDDSDAIEFPLEIDDEASPVMVEAICKNDIYAIDRRSVILTKEGE